MAGIRMYSPQPFFLASALYSISSSTKVSECSETKAIGISIILVISKNYTLYMYSTS